MSHFSVSYAIYLAQDNKLNAAYSKKNQGEMLWDVGRLAEARTALQTVLATIEPSQGTNKPFVANIHLLNARIYLSEGKYAEAKAELRLAAESAPSNAGQVRIKSILALAQAHTGATAEAKALGESALEMATKENDSRLLTETQLALAEVLLVSGDWPGARTVALKAQASAAKAKQTESEWRSWMIAGGASLRLRESDAARDQLSHAGNLLAQLKQSWGEEALNSYLTRRDIAFYRQQAGESSTATQ